MNNTNTSNSGFVPDADLTDLCLGGLGDPEVGAQSAGTLRLMGVSAPVNDGADARLEHYVAQGSMYETGIELANMGQNDEYRPYLVHEVAGRIVTVIATAIGRGENCDREISDFLSMFSASERAELLRSLEQHLAFADPERLGY